MNYVKPVVVLAGSALAAIHSIPKPLATAFDSGQFNGTVNAYEADE